MREELKTFKYYSQEESQFSNLKTWRRSLRILLKIRLRRRNNPFQKRATYRDLYYRYNFKNIRLSALDYKIYFLTPLSLLKRTKKSQTVINLPASIISNELVLMQNMLLDNIKTVYCISIILLLNSLDKFF